MADGLVMLTHVQSQVPVVFIVFKCFSVDRWKRWENGDENGHFWKRISVDGAK